MNYPTALPQRNVAHTRAPRWLNTSWLPRAIVTDFKQRLTSQDYSSQLYRKPRFYYQATIVCAGYSFTTAWMSDAVETADTVLGKPNIRLAIFNHERALYARQFAADRAA